MLPYYLLIFLPVIYSMISIGNTSKVKKQKRVIILFFCLLLALLSLRSPVVGNDTAGYKSFFLMSCNFGWNDIGDVFSEPAWFVLNKLVGIFTNSFQWFLFIVSFITILPIAYSYSRDTVYPVLTIALFVTMTTFVMLFSGLRQSVAIALGFIAYEFTKDRRFIPYILTVLLAFLFHRSAFMLLFMYPLYYAKITRKWLWVVIPAMTIVFIFNKPIFIWVTSFIAELYESSIQENDAITMLILLILFCVFSFTVPDESKLDDNTIGLRNFLLLSTIVQMFASLNNLAMRMGYYYLIFVPILLPKMIQCSSIRMKQMAILAKYVMVVFFVLYFFIHAPSSNVLNMFPYRFFWESTI